MLSIARHCGSRLILPQTRLLLCKNTPQTILNNGLRRDLFQKAWNKNSFLKNIKLSKLLRGTATVTLQLSTNASKKYQKAIGYWLLSCSGMVFVAVVLGGVTRLTESGLSMVTWKLLGEKMPTTEEEWQREFKKYQEYPEFKIKNKEITLAEFKRIWYMEYVHRMWGRAIGAVFLLPALFFWYKKAISPPLKKRLFIFGGLIAAQGLLGWYMVKSGLDDRFHGENDVPRVSQYRLAGHLGLALVLYSFLFWSSLHHLLPPETISNVSKQAIVASRKFRLLAHSCKGLLFATAISGAFTAGLDAGLIYNSFPKMADKWIPDDILANKPVMSNFTENPTTVQFNHRILGITTLTAISTLWLMSRRRILPRRAYIASNALGAMIWIQVALGITTLLMYVPTPIAASHQSGSLVLFSLALWLGHELKRLPKI